MSCKSCASKNKMSRIPAEERRRLAQKASKVRSAALKAQYEADKPRIDAYRVVYFVMAGAQQRCNTPSATAYKDYGGRGVEFRFPSTRMAAEWVLKNLGARPQDRSIDRIDNNGHYEPGNLRWATKSEQARNKRAYTGAVYAHRMNVLREFRPDYTYEGLRKFVKWGWTDEQIINHRKGEHVNSSIRSTKLRPAS
jgi:hypothetical protein